MLSKNTSFLAIAASLCLLATAPAAILTSGDFQTGTPTPTLSFSTPITFSITTAGGFGILAFDEWVTSDESGTGAGLVPTGQTIRYQINNGTVLTLRVDVLIDNLAENLGGLTPNDGFLQFSDPVEVAVGDTFTLLPGSLTFASDPAFNPPPAIFNGNVFLADYYSGEALSPLTSASAVPEPTTYALLLGSAGVFALVRFRKAKAASSFQN